MKSSSDLLSHLAPEALVLCDSNEDSEKPPEHIRALDQVVAIATSPKQKRWRWARKDVL